MNGFKQQLAKSVRVYSCIEWRGPTTKDGYGVFNIDGRPNTLVHRHMLETKLGRKLLPFPQELACHTCDNPRCINLEHLIVGTPASNASDMKRRNRSCVGIKHKGSKIDNGTVRMIKKLHSTGHRSQAYISDLLEIGRSRVSKIVRGLEWSHIK